MAVCNPQSVEKQTTLPETEQPADNVVAHAISAGIPATSLPAVPVLAEADTMTSVAQWADMQQKREKALPIIRGSSNRFPHSRGGRQFNFERVAECKDALMLLA